MLKFTANYCYSNNNFIISNLPESPINSPYTNIIRIVQNMIMRGAPTIASKFLRDQLKLEREYMKTLQEVKFLSKENLNWSRSIKGDVSQNDYPAERFYHDLEGVFNKLKYLRNMFIAECPISDILPDVAAFDKQVVDFYSPFLKTVIEVDGEGHKRQLALDRKRDQMFAKFGIKVVRINTRDIRNRNYQKFRDEFIEIYRLYKEKIDIYRDFLEMDPKEFDIQIKLTSIVRIQVFILELLDRGVLSLDDQRWNFNLLGSGINNSFELALKDLEIWIAHIAALFNKKMDLPHVNVKLYEKEAEFPAHSDCINIKFDLFKRWDDTIREQNVYHIRTDFDDDSNYFFMKVNEPVVYKLKPKKHRKHLEYLLENLFGFSEFREGQLEIIMNCLNGEDTVGLLPTGGGKSLTYQICVMLQPAISFVVAPIKSLMTDQINNIREKHHFSHVNYINSDLTPEQASQYLADFSKGKYYFLIISPERFQSKGFREQLSKINYTKAISLAVIDEVHCLSEWGHDFRTSYLALANSVRKFAPSARFLALTATASSKVLQDIMNELDIASNNVITISNFTRSELQFNFIETPKKEKDNQLMEYIRSIFRQNDKTKGPALVFTQTVNGKSGCFELSHSIKAWTGLRTGFYSGSAPKGYYSSNFSKDKDIVQQKFMKDEIDVLVATKAFGMGIDKGNIRHTIHFGIPNSLESFYQEAGRAGRDKEPSNCIVLYSPDSLNEEQMQTIFGVNTKQALLKSEMKKLSGDLNTLLFFLSTNLMDIEDEVEEIYQFYQANFSSGSLEVVVDFHNDQERERYEKSVYRLALLGVVEDWTMNWKSRQIEVELADWTDASVVEKLTNHIRKYDYTFTLEYAERNSEQHHELINHFQTSNQPFLKRILFVLLKWYNDNVIYSRKRSMLLMKEFADDFTDSQSLHQKIETYFKRNDDVYLLEKTVALKERLKDWFKIFYVQEEGKDDQPRPLSTFKSLKITVSRFLESYSNDISLNLINGFICLAHDEFDSIDGRDRMALAIREITRLDPVEREEMLTSILATADDFLSNDQRNELSEVLVSNGFDLMEDLKQIHLSLEDSYSYGSMIKSLHSTIREHAYGGYPWEA